MEQYALSFVPERRIWSLRDLSDSIRSALDRGFSNIWVSGEISGTKLVPSGHCYFTLKDSDAQIKCVCWKLSYWRLKFKPKDGVQVLVRGRVDIYELRSEYQFVVEAIEPQGEGALRLAFEQLKHKLLADGLFEASRKRPLPRFPSRIGIVSSPKGAVIRDFIEILSRRFPGLHVRLFPARVQGPRLGGRHSPRTRIFRPVRLGADHTPRARRRLARRPLDLQRGSSRARHRRFSHPRRLGHRT